MAESNKQPPVPERKNWDKGEWAEKAREKDRQARAYAQAKEKAMREGEFAVVVQAYNLLERRGDLQDPDQLESCRASRGVLLSSSNSVEISVLVPTLTPGKKFRPDDVALPGATKHAEAHNVDLEKNLGKTVLVSSTPGTGQRGAGFYCELCNRTLKDSLSYLDHLNSRFHLSKLGQSTHVARSTVAQVRARIAQLREQSKTKVDAKNYDFNKRLEEVRAAERAKREARREERRRKRAEEREKEELGRMGVSGQRGDAEVEAAVEAQKGMEEMMGFGGFGGGKRR